MYTTVYRRLGGIYTTVLRLEGRHIHHCPQARREDTGIYHPYTRRYEGIPLCTPVGMRVSFYGTPVGMRDTPCGIPGW